MQKKIRLAAIGMGAAQAIVAGLILIGILAGTAHAAQLSLTWTDASTNEDGFKIERATGTTGAYGQLASVAAGTTGYVDATVTAGTTYCYRVRAYNTAGDSAYSNAACGSAASATLYTVNVGKAGVGSGTVASSPNGITCGSDCSESYPSGTSVALSATPVTGSTFTGWSGGGCSGTGSCTLVVSANTSLTATFALSTPTTYTLTLTKNGTGSGTVTSNPSGINCGSTCSASYNTGTSVTLTAAAGTGSTFTGWSGACTGTGACTVSMTAARSVTATFATQTYALTVTKSGAGIGTVTSSPSGISCGSTCSASYTSGTSVTLTAAASTGSAFTGWSGVCTGTGTCTVSMTAARSVTATFESLPPATTLSAPSGSIASTTPTYTWNAVPGVTWYYLWVRDSASGNRVRQWYTAAQAGCPSGTGTCSAVPGTTIPPGAAQWWVQGWNANGYGPWGSGMNFTVTGGTAPAAASLVSPSGTVASSTPTYTWNAVSTATWYNVWVRDASGVTKIQAWYTPTQAGCGAGTGTCSITPSTSLGAAAYTWWVDTWNAAGYGPWSDPLSFSR